MNETFFKICFTQIVAAFLGSVILLFIILTVSKVIQKDFWSNNLELHFQVNSIFS